MGSRFTSREEVVDDAVHACLENELENGKSYDQMWVQVVSPFLIAYQRTAKVNEFSDVTIFEVIIRIICFKDGKTISAVLFKEILI